MFFSKNNKFTARKTFAKNKNAKNQIEKQNNQTLY